MIQRNVRDTVLLSGWLFADLLLGLMMIFLVSIQGAPHIPPTPPPVLTVTPSSLASDSSSCQGALDNSQCVVTVGETSNSIGSITWTVSNDMNDTIKYSSVSGILNPGGTTQVNISALPCQNGSLIFTGKAGGNVSTNTIMVPWKCAAKPVRLDTKPVRYVIDNVDYNGLLNNPPSQSAIRYVEQQLQQQMHAGPNARSRLGLYIVYDGAPSTGTDITMADNVDNVIYQYLKQDLPNFHDASTYDDLYLLGAQHTLVKIDVFYFTR